MIPTQKEIDALWEEQKKLILNNQDFAAKKAKCPFFSICGAGVIRERRGESWYQMHCFSNFSICCHFSIRKVQSEKP